MSEGSIPRRRRRASSPALAAPLPDDDDILREILLRLPPLPSSFPRASLVSKRWRRILSDPQFLRRFRAFHHGRAPLLGFFLNDYFQAYFTPTLDPPDRIPSARLSLAMSEDEDFLGCRHGLILVLNRAHGEIIVRDPVTRDQRRVALPPGCEFRCWTIHMGALLCDDHSSQAPLESFKVVLVWTNDVGLDADPRALALLYESKASVWSNIISTSIRAQLPSYAPSVLLGNSFFWLLLGDGNRRICGILEFDLDRKNLTVIDTPPDARVSSTFTALILQMEDSRLGFAIKIGFSIQVWEKKLNTKGGAKWMLHKTINLVKLLSLEPTEHTSWIMGYDEDSNAIFVSDGIMQVFMVKLKSLQFKRLSITDGVFGLYHHPFKSLYTTGRGIGSGDIGAEILNNT